MTDKNKTSGTDKNSSTPASPPAKEIAASSKATQVSSNQVSSNKNKSAQQKEPAKPEKSTKAEQANSEKNKKTEQANAEKSNKANQAKPEKPEQRKERGNTALVFSLLSIALVIASGAGIYYQTDKQLVAYSAKINALTSKIGSLKSDIALNSAKSQAAIQKNKQDMQVLIAQQSTTIESLQSALGDIKGRRPNDWLVAEADYLVNLAGRRLWLEDDVITATTLMETADQRLAELNDPSLTLIRQAIAKDIQQLKSIRRIDVDGIVLRLNSLQQEVSKLPLSNAILPAAQDVVLDEVSTDVNDWKQNLQASFTDFINQFITYKKRDGNVVPLLTSAQTFYLEENMKAQLAQAITAVYRKNGTLFDESLKTAKEWAMRFFDQNEPVTQSFIATLTFLDNQTIEATYPQVLLSQQLISDLLADRLRRDLAPLPSQETVQ